MSWKSSERRRGGLSIRHISANSHILILRCWVGGRSLWSWCSIWCWTSSASSASSEASTSTVATSIATTHCAEQCLHHCHWVLPSTAIGVSSTHSADVLSLGHDGQLSALEQWLVQVLGFDRAFFVYELNVCLPEIQNTVSNVNICSNGMLSYPRGWPVEKFFLICTALISPQNLKCSLNCCSSAA